jgi:hypothetical protein
MDEKERTAGFVVNQESECKARRMALADCAKGGAQDCEIVISYGNQCVAAAGNSTTSGYARAPSAEEAKAAAIRACGGDSCEVGYVACSLPVRVP